MSRIIVLPFVALMLLGACETVEGFGEDLSTGGRVIQEESNEVQAEL